MPIFLPASYMAVAFHHSAPGVTGEMVNTQAFDLTTHTGSAQDALNTVSQAWADGPHAVHANAVQYLHASAMVHDPILGPTAYDSTVGAIAGSGGTVMMPLNNAVIVQKHTPFAGRKFRGRWFLGGFSGTALSSTKPNEINDSLFNLLTTNVANFKGTCETAGIVPVLLHQGTLLPSLVSSYVVVRLVANQRKRIR